MKPIFGFFILFIYKINHCQSYLDEISSNNATTFDQLDMCCKRGLMLANDQSNCTNINGNNQTKSYSNITDPESRLCNELASICCHRKLSEIQCDQGIILARRIMLNQTKLRCENRFQPEQFANITTGINYELIPEQTFRCCMDCQLGIDIVQKYGSITFCTSLLTKLSSPLKLFGNQLLTNTGIIKKCCERMAMIATNTSEIANIDEQNNINKNINTYNIVDKQSNNVNGNEHNVSKQNENNYFDYVILSSNDTNTNSNDSKSAISTLATTTATNTITTTGLSKNDQYQIYSNASLNKFDTDYDNLVACLDGYRWDENDRICKDINECQLGTHSCHDALRCDNTIGSYICVRVQDCGTGYTINADTYDCDDIDECSLNIHNCGQDYRCRNTQGSFKCDRFRCPPGLLLINGFCRHMTCNQRGYVFDLNKGICQPRRYTPIEHQENVSENPCESMPCEFDKQCIPFGDNVSYKSSEEDNNEPDEERFICVDQCWNGYRFNISEMKCTDIDECAEGTFRCGVNQLCRNTEGHYECYCPPGYNHYVLSSMHNDGDSLGECVDINECLQPEIMFLCKEQSMTCLNTLGSYQCTCANGFYWDAEKKKCLDLDECAQMNPCEQICINTIGSYQCQCKSGFRESSLDPHKCVDIDECQEMAITKNLNKLSFEPLSLMTLTPMFRHKRRQIAAPPACRGICINKIGSFQCKCPKGFELIDNVCIDINECKRYDPCTGKLKCINFYGTFQCANINCLDGYRLEQTNKSIRCISTKPDNYLHNLNDFHEYYYLYYTMFQHQTTYLQQNKKWMPIYTVRFDPGMEQPLFQFNLKSATQFNAQYGDLKYPWSNSANTTETRRRSITMDLPSHQIPTTARAENFIMKISPFGNEASLYIVQPLIGPQLIELELICSGYRYNMFKRRRYLFTIFISEFDLF